MVYFWRHGTLNSAAIRPFGRCRPYNLLCCKYLGAMIISSLGRFVHCLANILLMAYHTSCYINTKCQVLIQQQSFIFFAIDCETVGTIYRSCCTIEARCDRMVNTALVNTTLKNSFGQILWFFRNQLTDSYITIKNGHTATRLPVCKHAWKEVFLKAEENCVWRGSQNHRETKLISYLFFFSMFLFIVVLFCTCEVIPLFIQQFS